MDSQYNLFAKNLLGFLTDYATMILLPMIPTVSTLSEKFSQELPVLIVDKKGEIGCLLAEKLQEKYLTLFVSSKEPRSLKNIIHVPFLKKVPVIPDNNFSFIFLFYHGEKELVDAIPSFIKKARDSDAKLIILTDIFHYRKDLSRALFHHYDKAQIFVYGDVFGQSLSPTSPVKSLLFSAKTYGRVDLPNSGLDMIYPVFDEDVVDAIIKVVFSSDASLSSIFLLYPSHSVTQITVARLLQKLYPLLLVDFIKQKQSVPKVTLPEDGIPVFSSYPLESRLKQIDLTHTPLSSYTREERHTNVLKPFQNKQRKPLFLFLSFFFFILSIPILSSVGGALLAGFFLLQAQKTIEKGEFEPAESYATAAVSLFSFADHSSSILRSVLKIFGASDEIMGFQTMIHTGGDIAESVSLGIKSLELISNVLDGKSKSPKQDFYTGINQLQEAIATIYRLKAEGRLPSPYKEKLVSIEKIITLFMDTSETYPALLGFNKKQTYLVLFQNNFELRPGGGFIGSYGILEIEKGRIQSFEVFDVYDVDGRFKQHIDPPFVLQRYMGVPHWYLRDSNYSPDFSTSAANVANFFKLETEKEVDGVIALDVTFLSMLLEEIGPVKIPDYNETVTKDNVFLVTQRHVEKDFFPGSTQKKDFLNALRHELEVRLFQDKGKWDQIVKIVIKGIEQKHLLFAFADSSLQKLYSLNQLSSSLREYRENKENLINDFLAINEANIGLNKSNFYLRRKIDHEVAIDGEGHLTHTLSVTYTNTSTTSSPFGGEYKAYVRFLVPKGALLQEVLIDDKLQKIPPAVTDPKIYTSSKFIPPSGLEVEQTTEIDRAVFGMLLNVPVKGNKKLTIKYRLAEVFDVSKQTFSYDLWMFKQPGVLNDPYSLVIMYPLSVRVLSTTQPVSDLGGKIRYSSKLTTDQLLRLNFARR